METLKTFTSVSPSSPLAQRLDGGSKVILSPAVFDLTKPANLGQCGLQVITQATRFHQDRGARTRNYCFDRIIQGSTIRAVPAQVAHELLNAGHHFLDVRTAEEFSAGHAEGAINIPYMHKIGTGLSKNWDFLENVEERFGKDAEIVVGCEKGQRSQMAAVELLAVGFTGITDLSGGYAAWVQSGMPIETKVETRHGHPQLM